MGLYGYSRVHGVTECLWGCMRLFEGTWGDRLSMGLYKVILGYMRWWGVYGVVFVCIG